MHGLGNFGIHECGNLFTAGGEGSAFVVELGVIVETVEGEVVIEGFAKTEVEILWRIVVSDIVPGYGFGGI